MIDVVVPAEQEGTKAVVRAWLRQIGDRVEENDPLVELETDKVAMEIPAPAAGVLREILLQTGEDAVPGAVLGRIAQESDAPAPGLVRPERGRGASAQAFETRPSTSLGTNEGWRVLTISRTIVSACSSFSARWSTTPDLRA